MFTFLALIVPTYALEGAGAQVNLLRGHRADLLT